MGRYSNIEILFVSDKNVKFERRDMKKRSEVRVINNNCNFTLHTYRFNNVKVNYDTKYMNWANVNCCGGWVHNEAYLENAIQNDCKLFASLNGTYSYKDGCVADYIDIENVFDVYSQFGITLFEDDKDIIRKMSNEKMSIYVNKNNKFSFDYANPVRIHEWVFNGMLLGYPIETTVSILEFMINR
ncbi:MAG: hypothetical protein J6D47_11880 [Peptostreptococcaceae bacterium]|nr:hypothetical protein [Peptostreptococcaceae bacterium]